MKKPTKTTPQKKRKLARVVIGGGTGSTQRPMYPLTARFASRISKALEQAPARAEAHQCRQAAVRGVGSQRVCQPIQPGDCGVVRGVSSVRLIYHAGGNGYHLTPHRHRRQAVPRQAPHHQPHHTRGGGGDVFREGRQGKEAGRHRKREALGTVPNATRTTSDGRQYPAHPAHQKGPTP